jgi:hypothetical protein
MCNLTVWGGIEALRLTLFTLLVTVGKWFASHSAALPLEKESIL